MDDMTASGAYGFQSFSHAFPGGMATQPMTDVGAGNIPDGVMPKLGFGHQNPLFWVLVIFLIITGYLTFGFDIGIKKLGQLKFGT
jgi:hypothetical protein